MPEPRTAPVQMLWEPVDPQQTLRQRFGFARAQDATDWIAGVLGDRWGIQVQSCERIVLSDANALAWVRTPSGPRIAKWCVSTERFHRLAQLARLMQWLDHRDLPVSAPIATLAGDLQLEVDGVSIGLQRQVPGELLDVGRLAQVHATGAVVAQLHNALGDYPGVNRLVGQQRPAMTLAQKVLGWLDSHPGHGPAAARTRLHSMIADAQQQEVPVQLVHGDIRSANVLCLGDRVSGVLDFEDATVKQPIDELARSAVLLGTRFRDWGPVTPEIRACLRAGYETVRPLTPAEACWWNALVLWHSLAMIPAGEDPTGWVRAIPAEPDLRH